MALEHAGQHYTKWVHVENGKTMVRRLHRIEVQGRDGRLYIIRGKDLPEFIQTCAGQGFKGEHLAQILVNPDKLRPTFVPTAVRPWPSWRDLMSVGIGIVFVGVVKFITSLVAACM